MKAKLVELLDIINIIYNLLSVNGKVKTEITLNGTGENYNIQNDAIVENIRVYIKENETIDLLKEINLKKYFAIKDVQNDNNILEYYLRSCKIKSWSILKEIESTIQGTFEYAQNININAFIFEISVNIEINGNNDSCGYLDIYVTRT